MPKLRRLAMNLCCGAGLLCAGGAQAAIINLNLNDFVANPLAGVSVNAGGDSATLSEVALGTFGTLLQAGSDLIQAAPGRLLQFDFDFMPGGDNSDEFRALIVDEDNPLPILLPPTPSLSFRTQNPTAGAVSFDLSSQVGGGNIGLAFLLDSVDNSLDSLLTVSNVRFVDPDPPPTDEQPDQGTDQGSPPSAQVPEPGTLAVLLAGLIAWAGLRRTRVAARARS